MSGSDHPVIVQLPADSGFLRIARLNATAYGARLDLDVEQLDDLRLAVNEALTWLLDDPSHPSTVVLRLHQEGTQLVIAGSTEGTTAELPAAADPASPDHTIGEDLLMAILGATVDDFALEASPRGFELRKGR